MEVLFFIVVFGLLVFWAYFFPDGVKIFGFPAKDIFGKKEEEE